MFNYNNAIVLHNSYQYKLIEQDGTIVDEGIVYNEAHNNIYVADVGASSIKSAPLTLVYKRSYTDSEGNIHYSDSLSTIGAGVAFSRTTPEQSVNFGTNIAFVGVAEFPASTSFVGLIESAGIGNGKVIQDEEGKVVEYQHWSDVSLGITKTETTMLILTITLYITPSRPNLQYVYDSSISSVTRRLEGTFPSPGIGFIGLSPMDLKGLPQNLKKKIPTVASLPTIVERSYDDNSKNYYLHNPENSVEQPGSFFIPGSGSSGYPYDAVHYNFGVMQTVVYGGAGAESLNGGSIGGNSVIIPVVKLTAQYMKDLLDTGQSQYYFFCVPPVGCICSGITVNGVDATAAEVSFKDPHELTNIDISAVGMNDEERVDISAYRNTNEGEYYANYLFGTYWEPPTGTAVCPNYLYLANKPTNIYTGGNCSARIEGYIDEHWVNLVSSEPYTVIQIPIDEDIEYSEYRVIVKSPDMTNSNYYTNLIESSVTPYKAYDPFVLRIGDEQNNFGECGLRVSRNTLENWYNSLNSDQTQVTNYTLGMKIQTQGVFYKSANILAYLKYEARVSGN